MDNDGLKKIYLKQNNWINPSIMIQNSPIHRRGMFAKRNIAKGELLIVWKESYTNKAGALEATMEGKGTMQWDEDIFSVETDLHVENYLINHSCDPNSWMTDAYSLEARRNIPKRKEITVDIAMFESQEDSIAQWECNCGSSLCRGKITGKDWMRKDLQEMYRGHFSPLLNKRIKDINVKTDM
jgi:hypothetical protein